MHRSPAPDGWSGPETPLSSSRTAPSRCYQKEEQLPLDSERYQEEKPNPSRLCRPRRLRERHPSGLPAPLDRAELRPPLFQCPKRPRRPIHRRWFLKSCIEPVHMKYQRKAERVRRISWERYNLRNGSRIRIGSGRGEDRWMKVDRCRAALRPPSWNSVS